MNADWIACSIIRRAKYPRIIRKKYLFKLLHIGRGSPLRSAKLQGVNSSVSSVIVILLIDVRSIFVGRAECARCVWSVSVGHHSPVSGGESCTMRFHWFRRSQLRSARSRLSAISYHITTRLFSPIPL